ncbi:Rpn family recombination-promoting nuclease/putative transposase [Olivibacter domesticus]|uniref:Rpn family recombination-promoting nuclease/putative transposase n=1 Tax=Olivibacter domesticus TaxID=407022 RepID=A0A1H7WRT4_OLID1|nr:Rpn family recombination-promoting nuclease/putative transposase [Olivibacter domesticus]SEM23945.1 conserved hypothetical protein (putative transposase or invertase) [Olivibacter domesticus]
MTKNNLEKPTVGRFIDPGSDFGFKFLFGKPAHQDILIPFLNELIGSGKRIKNLVYGPTEYLGETADQKKVIFDLRCTGDNGEEIIVEMQRMNHDNFKERVMFSTSRLISSQYPKGVEYWNFELPAVIFIGILEFRMDDMERERYLKSISLIDKDSGRIFYSKLSYIFLELPNFAKKDEEIKTDKDRWFWLLNNLSKADKIPTFMNKRIFQRIFKIAELSNLTKEERMAYEASLQDKWLWNSAMSLAEKKAAEQERSKADQEKLVSAQSLKKAGVANHIIAESLKLPLTVVEKL